MGGAPSLSKDTRLMHGPPPSQHTYKPPGEAKPLLVYSPMTIKQVTPSGPEPSVSASLDPKSPTLTNASQGSLSESYDQLKRVVKRVGVGMGMGVGVGVLPSHVPTEGQISLHPDESDSAVDPSNLGPSPADLAPSYGNQPLQTPTITIVETQGFRKGKGKGKQGAASRRIDIPVMRVQAQQHRSKFLQKGHPHAHPHAHCVNQTPSFSVSKPASSGPLIKVVAGKQRQLRQFSQRKRLEGAGGGATPMMEEDEEDEDFRAYDEAGLYDKGGSDSGLFTNTSVTGRGNGNGNGSARNTPALVARSISRSARPSPKSRHFVARHSSSVEQPRTVAEVSESGGTTVPKRGPSQLQISPDASPKGGAGAAEGGSGGRLKRADTPSEKRNVVFSTTKRSMDLRGRKNIDLILQRHHHHHRSEGSPTFKLSAPAVLDALRKYNQALHARARPVGGAGTSGRNEVISVPSAKDKDLAPSESATPSPSPLKSSQLQPKMGAAAGAGAGRKVDEITEKSEMTPTPQPGAGPGAAPTPRSVAKDTLAGTSKGFSYKNSLTQDSVLTTNTNFTPTRWLPKGMDRESLQHQAFLEDLLALHLPHESRFAGGGGAGRYKGVTPSDLAGRTVSIPRGSKGSAGAPFISDTEKQRTRYQRVQQRRNVLRDEQFLHREGDFYKDIFLDEYYKRRQLARREDFFRMLESRLEPPPAPRSSKASSVGAAARRPPPPPRAALTRGGGAFVTPRSGSLLSPAKIADSF